MKREEEKTTYTNHRALKNQTHIVRWEKNKKFLCLIFEKYRKQS